MTTRVTFSGLDYSLEGTSSSLYMADLSAGNFVAQTTAIGGIQTAIQGVSLIAYDGQTYPALVEAREEVAPASPFAQRESKWLVRYVDDVNAQKGDFEIGGADLALLVAGTDLMNITAGAGAALVAALELSALSRDGNAITVIEVEHVGRST